MNCIKWRWISWIIGIIGVILFLIALVSDNFWQNSVSYLSIILLIASGIIGIVKFRCPSCGKHISDRSPISISHCPYCGKKLN